MLAYEQSIVIAELEIAPHPLAVHSLEGPLDLHIDKGVENRSFPFQVRNSK